MIYILLIILGFATRFIPHLANFSAVGAIALYGGYYFKDKRIAFLVPMVIMFLTDLIIGLYQWQLLLSVYVSFALIVFLATLIKKKKWFYALPAAVLSSIVFFLVTNWAFWQFTAFYPHTFEGLISCYAAGLPFLKNTFAGDFIYTFSLFSLTELAVYFAKQSKYKKALLAGGK